MRILLPMPRQSGRFGRRASAVALAMVCTAVVPQRTAALIVGLTPSGTQTIWDSQTAINLTYCIDQKSLPGSQYNAVVANMNSAAGSWEAAAGGRINFIHVASFDTSCSRKSPVVFHVQGGNLPPDEEFIRAFTPVDPRSKRELKVDPDAFGNVRPFSLAGLFRHALGHALGLRHEHTRPEAGVCFEDNDWQALTPYDSDSVMHFPSCNGTNLADLDLTSSDKAGVANLYP